MKPALGQNRVRLFTVALDTFPPQRVDITELFDKALAARGYDLDWAMWRREPGRGQVIDLPGGHHCVLGAKSARGDLLSSAFAWLPYSLRILRQIARGRYDIVQVRDMPLFAWFVMHAARRHKTRFTYWMSYPMAESRRFRADNPDEILAPWKRTALRLFGRVLEYVQYRIVLPHADHVFVQSEVMRRDVAARGIDPRKITPVPMGLLPEELPPVVAGDPFPGRKVIVHLGTLIRVRRPEFLIDVLTRVRAAEPRALLVLIGDAPPQDMAVLKDYAARKGEIDHIRFLGALPRFDALVLTRHAAVCVSPFPPHPLNDSTSPTKLIEYLALGRPVIVNNHPDQTQVIKDSGAGISTPYAVEPFADAIIRLLQNPSQAEAMGACGPRYVAAYRAYPILAARVDAAYRALLALAKNAQ